MLLVFVDENIIIAVNININSKEISHPNNCNIQQVFNKSLATYK